MNEFFPHFPTLNNINSHCKPFSLLLPNCCSRFGILYTDPKPCHVKTRGSTENIGSVDQKLTINFVFAISYCRFCVTPSSYHNLVSVTFFTGSQEDMRISLTISSKFKKTTFKETRYFTPYTIQQFFVCPRTVYFLFLCLA